ncbi:hypothetical protein Tco_0931552 [Tanacetum coccineum]
MEKSTVSSLLEEKKKLKYDFKIREDELLDKQIQLENKIKELDNILVKTGQSIQMMHILSSKPDSFYHTKQKMALGYQNPFCLKQAKQKQQSLYDGKVLLEKHDPPVVYDSEETLELAQESHLKMKQLNKEIKPANYTKINHISGFLANEADVSLAKHKALELEIERLLKAIASQDILSIVQSNSVIDTLNLQTELDPYNDMQQKIEGLQAQLGDQKGKSKDTPCVSNTLDPLSQKLENENVELEFQVRNYEKENAHLKTTYKNLFDSISVTRSQTKTIIDSLQNKLHDTMYENAKLRAQLFDMVSEQKDTTKGTSVNTQFCKQSILGKPPSSSKPKLYVVTFFPNSKGLPKIDKTHALSKPVTSNSIPTPQESKVVNNDKVIAPGMFRINPFKPSREDKYVPNKVRASVRTNPITVSQPHVITKKDVNSDSNGLSSIGVDNVNEELEPKTITKVVEIASSQSTPFVLPLETPPLSAQKPKEDSKPNPHPPLIPYLPRFKEEIFQALENPTGCADHFVYKIDIVDSWCDKFPIENNSMSGNPTLSNFVVESPSPSPIPYEDSDSLVEETDILLSHFDDSPPEYETFSFDIKEESSGSNTTHFDYSLPEYDSFIFDLSIDPLPPADRSDFYHEEFADELAHITSPSEYDYFYFDLETDPGEFTRVLKENVFDLSTKGLTINELNDSSLLLSDCDSSLSKEFSEIDLLVSFPSGNEDMIFDLGIFIIKRVQSKRFQFFPLDDFPTFSFVGDSLLLIDPSEIETCLSFPSGNEDKDSLMILKDLRACFQSSISLGLRYFHDYILGILIKS